MTTPTDAPAADRAAREQPDFIIGWLAQQIDEQNALARDFELSGAREAARACTRRLEWLYESRECVRALIEQVRALEAQIAAAREDAARLDWLDADRGDHVLPTAGFEGRPWGFFPGGSFAAGGHAFTSIRSAIDAAREDGASAAPRGGEG